jgi:hypothetical protein
MKKILIASLPLVLIPVAVLMVNCGGAVEPDALTTSDGIEMGQTTSAVCTTYDSAITSARNWIAANCAGITGCGSADSYTHADLQISGGTSAMCSCYGKMWNARGSAPFNTLQVIYHPYAACSNWPHIHLQSGKNNCGTLHFDVDDSSNNCYDDDTGTAIDEAFCGSGTIKSTCGPGGGGGWNCANSSYNGVQYWTCNGNNRTKCDASGNPTTSTCGWACYTMPTGRDDLCVNTTTGWNCANSAYGGTQLWTCSGGSLYKCSGTTNLKVTCPLGCNVNPLGTNDTCK